MIFPEISTADLLPEGSILDRRSMLSGLGLAGLGLLATSASASAFTAQRRTGSPRVTVEAKAAEPKARIDLTGLPADWARLQGSVLPEYTRYLHGLKLKSVTSAQVIAAHAKNKSGIWNSLPPKTWWSRMGYMLRVADRVALEMNVKEVEVVSAYRSPAYNAQCEGAKVGSWHQANVAVDVKFPGPASQVTAVARNLRDRGLFKGGVGGYWNFTHLDARGVNVNW